MSDEYKSVNPLDLLYANLPTEEMEIMKQAKAEASEAESVYNKGLANSLAGIIINQKVGTPLTEEEKSKMGSFDYFMYGLGELTGELPEYALVAIGTVGGNAVGGPVGGVKGAAAATAYLTAYKDYLEQRLSGKDIDMVQVLAKSSNAVTGMLFGGRMGEGVASFLGKQMIKVGASTGKAGSAVGTHAVQSSIPKSAITSFNDKAQKMAEQIGRFTPEQKRSVFTALQGFASQVADIITEESVKAGMEGKAPTGEDIANNAEGRSMQKGMDEAISYRLKLPN